ncbi:helix-turn-helix domain-containing protein [Desulfonatronum thioautotrophicum]|uniref:helix-turn-helix domain-containing protein n=1 Tax=Desulfonatronum thioautotrophicum TaxID=617001 RepID=UPI0005EBE283|nr:RodZ domain-containing protein [Desulfonatronum thioautotrophicum]
MDLKEFGRLLKEERLRQGLEIADVMDKTKISRMNLVAIEEGNEQALPHPVYAKGFVKNYARFLGMDADKMGNTLAQIYVSQEESEYDDLVLADAAKLPSVREGLPLAALLATVLAVIIVVVGGIWFFKEDIRGVFSWDRADDPTPTVTGRPGTEPHLGPPSIQGEIPGEPAPALDGEPGSQVFPSLAGEPIGDAPEDTRLPELQSLADELASDPVAPDVQTQAEGDAPIDAPADAPRHEAVEPPAPTLVEPEQPGTATIPGQPEETPIARAPVLTPAGVEKTLEIRATENCWLSAQADDARPREAFLRPGERFVITFLNTLELRLGNAGGVNLYLDGEPWPLSAQSGEVMSLRFP